MPDFSFSSLCDVYQSMASMGVPKKIKVTVVTSLLRPHLLCICFKITSTHTKGQIQSHNYCVHDFFQLLCGSLLGRNTNHERCLVFRLLLNSKFQHQSSSGMLVDTIDYSLTTSGKPCIFFFCCIIFNKLPITCQTVLLYINLYKKFYSGH